LKRIPLLLIIISSPTIFVGLVVVVEGIVILPNGMNDGIIYGTPLLASGILLMIIAMKKQNEVEVKEK
jgi:hypothetical protein